jgi:hypothetical protein
VSLPSRRPPKTHDGKIVSAARAGDRRSTPSRLRVAAHSPRAGARIASVDANTAIVLVVLWLIGSLAVAALFTERAEISG